MDSSHRANIIRDRITISTYSPCPCWSTRGTSFLLQPNAEPHASIWLPSPIFRPISSVAQTLYPVIPLGGVEIRGWRFTMVVNLMPFRNLYCPWRCMLPVTKTPGHRKETFALHDCLLFSLDRNTSFFRKEILPVHVTSSLLGMKTHCHRWATARGGSWIGVVPCRSFGARWRSTLLTPDCLVSSIAFLAFVLVSPIWAASVPLGLREGAEWKVRHPRHPRPATPSRTREPGER